MSLTEKEIDAFWTNLCKNNKPVPLNEKELAKLKNPYRSLAEFFTTLTDFCLKLINSNDEVELDDELDEDDESDSGDSLESLIRETLLDEKSQSDRNSRSFRGLSVEQFLTNPDFLKFCTLYWGKEWGKLIPQILAYRLEGIFQTGYDRRSFRSRKNASRYVPILQVFFQRFNLLKLYGLGPKELLNLWMEKPELFSSYTCFATLFLPQLIAIELDGGDKKLTEYIHTTVYENTGQMSHVIIEALFYSHKESSWKMAADLLLAAQLQEGLRQVITEKCNEGNMPAFRYLLKVIYDNNLLRFASVKRAFDTWTGLGLESVRDNTIKKTFDLACQYLEDSDKARNALKSDNPMEVFLGL